MALSSGEITTRKPLSLKHEMTINIFETRNVTHNRYYQKNSTYATPGENDKIPSTLTQRGRALLMPALKKTAVKPSRPLIRARTTWLPGDGRTVNSIMTSSQLLLGRNETNLGKEPVQ